ncbi:glycosyltransferase family 2 protein [Deminuibacter soli]|nr:glycosyltransferase family 2 protein [Deminuibacter soli]
MQAKRPLITIITPVYNAASLIVSCIEKLQQQSSVDFEHLVVDGLSNDNTVELVRDCQQRYANLRLVSEKDQGVYDAMNKGIQHANGQWLFFLGADDYLYSTDVLEKIGTHLQQAGSDVQLLYGNVYYEAYSRLYDGMFDHEKILKRNVCHQAVFYRATVFAALGNYSLLYPSEADYEFNLRCWLSGRVKQIYVPLTIAWYAQGGLSGAGRDTQLVHDYPAITTRLVAQGQWPAAQKINLLSKVFRKLVQRYPAAVWKKACQVPGHSLTCYLAMAWMIGTLPFYLIFKNDKDSPA